MSPGIPVGSVVFVVPTNKVFSPILSPKYLIGDIITFKRAGQIVTHRIIKTITDSNGIYYQTKGDANNSIDTQLVSQSDIIGQGVFTVPYIGRLFVFARKPMGFISMVLFPSIYIIVMEIFTIFDELKRNKNNNEITITT
jgi:signal peptidase